MSIDDSDAALQIVEAGRQRVIARLRAAFARQVEATADLGEVDPAALDGLIAQATDRAGASLWRISLAEGAAEQYGITIGEALNHHAVASAAELVAAPEEPVAVPAWATLPTVTAPAPRLPEPVLYDTAPSDDPNDPGWDELGPGDDEAHDPPAHELMTAALQEPTPADEDESDPERPSATDGTEPALTTETTTSSSTPQAIRIAAVHSGGIETLKAGDKDLELRFSDAGLDVIRRSSGVAIGRLDWSEVTSVELEQNRKGLRGKRSRSIQVRTSRGQAAFELPGLTDEEANDHLEPMLGRLRDSGTLRP